jgi:hypothetical protein
MSKSKRQNTDLQELIPKLETKGIQCVIDEEGITIENDDIQFEISENEHVDGLEIVITKGDETRPDFELLIAACILIAKKLHQKYLCSSAPGNVFGDSYDRPEEGELDTPSELSIIEITPNNVNIAREKLGLQSKSKKTRTAGGRKLRKSKKSRKGGKSKRAGKKGGRKSRRSRR